MQAAGYNSDNSLINIYGGWLGPPTLLIFPSYISVKLTNVQFKNVMAPVSSNAALADALTFREESIRVSYQGGAPNHRRTRINY